MSARILKSTALTGAMTLLSRISGLARDVLFARLIGAGAGVAADAFYVALRIPNFFRRIFAEGAFAQAFVPVFVEYHHGGDAARTREFADHLTGLMAGILFLATAVGVVGAPWFIHVLAPGFAAEPAKFDLTVRMLRVTFPYLFFISLVAMAGGILNSYGRFGAAAFTPVLLNLSLIIAALLFAPYSAEPAMALAWGVLIAGLAQLLFQMPFLVRVGMLPRLRWNPRHAGVVKVLRLMLPAILGSSVAQINMLVNTLLASFLVTGSVSWLYYSDRVMEFPLGVFGIALATVILPSLSRSHAQGDGRQFSRLLDWSLRLVVLIALPSALALALLAAPMIATLFHYGVFTDQDVVMSARALLAFAIGLPAFIIVKVLAPGFFARQDTRTPAKIAVVAMLANVGFSLTLVWSLAHAGLALAVSLAAFVNAGLLFAGLVRKGVFRPQPGWGIFFLQIGVGCAVMAAVLVWLSGQIGDFRPLGAWVRILRLAELVGAGLLSYLLALLALGIRPAVLIGRRRERDD